MISIRVVLYIVAFVLLLLSGLQVSTSRLNFLGLGLAAWVLAEMLRP